MRMHEINSFLRSHTLGIVHSGRSLYQHLKGTHKILEDAHAPEHICLAGMFHSIYGTNVFRPQAITLENRATVAKTIGQHAERLAYIFCACNRPRALIDASYGEPYEVLDRYTGHIIPLTKEDLYGLLTIELANLMEQKSGGQSQVRLAMEQMRNEMLPDMR